MKPTIILKSKMDYASLKIAIAFCFIHLKWAFIKWLLWEGHTTVSWKNPTYPKVRLLVTPRKRAMLLGLREREWVWGLKSLFYFYFLNNFYWSIVVLQCCWRACFKDKLWFCFINILTWQTWLVYFYTHSIYEVTYMKVGRLIYVYFR